MSSQVWSVDGIKVEARHEAFSLYWYFAAERHNILLKRLAGQPSPWTEDPILASFKFCNSFRVADRVSQYLLRTVIYGDTPSCLAATDSLFRSIVFRFFSRESTWDAIEAGMGGLTASGYDPERFSRILDGLFASDERLYTGAFILCANNVFGERRKHHNHARLFEMIAEPENMILEDLLRTTSLSGVYERLLELPLVGPFMAYQIATDLNYGPHINFSEQSFTAAGPGAKRGIRKCFVDTGGLSDERLIHWVGENQEELAAYYGLLPPTLFGRRLQPIDCQSLFCETDKYCRVALPGLRSERQRIKANFRARASLPEFFSPPKWGLDRETGRESGKVLG